MNVAALLGLPDFDEHLARVDAALREAVVATDPYLAEMAGHLLGAGGKRLRPALAVTAALAGGAEVSDDVIQGAAAVELVHLGSLHHDDVMDEAELRRNVDTVNARWGNLAAILSGDFLLARASGIAASLGVEVAALLAATIARLCEGQVGELKHAFDVDRTEEAYLASIAGKTASLLATSCRIGALAAGLPREQVEALTAFGSSFGMVFQIRDDILDLISTDTELGKPAGNDLVEGVYSLPVILALRTEHGDELRSLLGHPIDGPENQKARDLVRASTAVPQAVAIAATYATQAATALTPLPPTPITTRLQSLPTALLQDLT